MYAKAKAAELWYRYRLSLPVDLRRLVEALGLEVVTFPLRGRLQEVIIDGVVAVRRDMPRPWFRWYVSHALGHHLLHVGSGFYLESWQWVNVAQAEREAEVFAAWLLAGPEGWRYSHQELGIPFEKYLLVRQLAAGPGPAPQLPLGLAPQRPLTVFATPSPPRRIGRHSFGSTRRYTVPPKERTYSSPSGSSAKEDMRSPDGRRGTSSMDSVTRRPS